MTSKSFGLVLVAITPLAFFFGLLGLELWQIVLGWSFAFWYKEWMKAAEDAL